MVATEIRIAREIRKAVKTPSGPKPPQLKGTQRVKQTTLFITHRLSPCMKPVDQQNQASPCDWSISHRNETSLGKHSENGQQSYSINKTSRPSFLILRTTGEFCKYNNIWNRESDQTSTHITSPFCKSKSTLIDSSFFRASFVRCD